MRVRSALASAHVTPCLVPVMRGPFGFDARGSPLGGGRGGGLRGHFLVSSAPRIALGLQQQGHEGHKGGNKRKNGARMARMGRTGTGKMRKRGELATDAH